MRDTLCRTLRELSDPYHAWLEEHLPDEDIFAILRILPVTEHKGYVRRTKQGITIGVTQPLEDYLAATTETEMMDLADRDFAALEALIIRRWQAPPPPDVRYPATEDVEDWRRLGHLLMAGEAPEPLIDLWRSGDLGPE